MTDKRTAGYVIAYVEPGGLIDKDGRFKVGDELVNVNGNSLRGLGMEEARNVLKNISGMVDIIVARCPETPESVGKGLALGTPGSGGTGLKGPKPLQAAVRRRRRLPVLDRPRSAPLSGELISDICSTTTAPDSDSKSQEGGKSDPDQSVLDICDFSSNQAAMKTVIKVCSGSKLPQIPPAALLSSPAVPPVSIPVTDQPVVKSQPPVANRLRLTNSLSSVKGETAGVRQLPEVPTNKPQFTSPSPFVRKQQALNNAGLKRRNRVNSCRSASPSAATTATNSNSAGVVTITQFTPILLTPFVKIDVAIGEANTKERGTEENGVVLSNEASLVCPSGKFNDFFVQKIK